MIKPLSFIALASSAAIALAACSAPAAENSAANAPAATTTTAVEPSAAAEAPADGTPVTITAGDVVMTATLNDSQVAQDFAATLPDDVDMTFALDG
jgi:hypothetical protein